VPGAEPRSRREFLALGLGAVLVAVARCATGPTREEIEAQAARYDRALDCTDASKLWPAERKTREDNRYVDRSDRAREGEYCFRCDNFEAPPDLRTCGTCRTVKGPIHPLGRCNAWILRRS
jgi:hypothetical protein